jgi:hypothetical protein
MDWLFFIGCTYLIILTLAQLNRRGVKSLICLTATAISARE